MAVKIYIWYMLIIFHARRWKALIVTLCHLHTLFRTENTNSRRLLLQQTCLLSVWEHIHLLLVASTHSSRWKCSWTKQGNSSSSEITLSRDKKSVWDQKHRGLLVFCVCVCTLDFSRFKGVTFSDCEPVNNPSAAPLSVCGFCYWSKSTLQALQSTDPNYRWHSSLCSDYCASGCFISISLSFCLCVCVCVMECINWMNRRKVLTFTCSQVKQ